MTSISLIPQRLLQVQTLKHSLFPSLAFTCILSWYTIAIDLVARAGLSPIKSRLWVQEGRDKKKQDHMVFVCFHLGKQRDGQAEPGKPPFNKTAVDRLSQDGFSLLLWRDPPYSKEITGTPCVSTAQRKTNISSVPGEGRLSSQLRSGLYCL